LAKNSTRKQITNEARKMLFDIENAMMRLKRIDELGQCRSPVIDKFVPPLIQSLNTVHGFVETFRSKL